MATYPGAAFPGGQAPLFSPVSGPATLGPAPAAGAPGGVPGVSMAPVSGIQPPAGPGGPHPLPAMPQVPLPQGFPNPFALQQLQAQPPGAPGPQTQMPGTGGVTTITGPQGYLPGIGHFGTPGGPGQPGMPGPAAGLPAPYYTGMPQTHAPVGMPGMQPQTPLPTPYQAAPSPSPAPALVQQPGVAQQSPFWLHLAWQLAQTPAVKAALGDQLPRLLADDRRNQTLQIAVQCLQSQEVQAAFRALTTGAMDQSRFTEAFAGALRTALRNARLIEA